MFIRSFWFICCLCFGSAALAQSADPYAGVLNGPANDDSLGNAFHHMQMTGCNKACHALGDVWWACYQIFFDQWIPNSLARLRPESQHTRDVRAAREFRETLFSHPGRFGLYCQIIQKVAAHVDFQHPEWITRPLLTALLIDRHIGDHRDRCTRAAIAALPKSPKIQDLFNRVGHLCRGDWPRYGCWHYPENWKGLSFGN